MIKKLRFKSKSWLLFFSINVYVIFSINPFFIQISLNSQFSINIFPIDYNEIDLKLIFSDSKLSNIYYSPFYSIIISNISLSMDKAFVIIELALS